MEWKYILSKKRKGTMVLFSVLLMIVMISYVHKKNLSDMEENVTSIYEDRLVANEYIFELSQKIAGKKWLMSNEQNMEDLTELNHEIVLLMDAYEKTKLTMEENSLWEKLKKDLSLAREFENQILHNLNSSQRSKIQHHLNNQYQLIDHDLEGLSLIQLKEGKSLLDESRKILASNSISSRLEVALVIIGLLIFLMFISTHRVGRIKSKMA